MPYCHECGVEIGNAALCPLCGTKNARCVEASHEEQSHAQAEDIDTNINTTAFFGEARVSENFTAQEGRTITWEVLTVAFSIAIVSLLAINMIANVKLSWSLYPVATFVFLWVCTTALFAMDRVPRLRYTLISISPPLYLLALGAITGDMNWAWRLALPIAIYSEILIAAIVLSIAGTKRKGLNTFSFILIGIAILCIGLEIFIDLYSRGKIRITWSAITAIALVPIASFLFYLHERVAKSTNLRRLFKL
jgi:hypothetical protein